MTAHRGSALVSYLRALVPSGVRRQRRLDQLQRRHGLTSLGNDFPYLMSESTSFGDNCRISARVRIFDTTVGDWSYVEHDCHISSTDIGRYTSVAPFTVIGLAEHPSRTWVSTHPRFYLHRPRSGYDLVSSTRYEEFARATIGSDVWIGVGARVRGGTTIGHGAIVGAGSVVTRDVPPYAVVAGSPARLVRYRFDEDDIAFLLDFRWWERDDAWLRANVDAFVSVDRLRELA